MKKTKRTCALLLALLIAVTCVQGNSEAVLDGVYFSAANDQLLDLSEETMPFWSNGELYISSQFFQDTDLGIMYVYSPSMNLAVLHNRTTNLKFDLANSTVYDNDNKFYSGHAIKQSGQFFFPINLVCSYFGLKWSLTHTSTVPLLRVTNNQAILSDTAFIDAASSMMLVRYAAYKKAIQNTHPQQNTPQPPSPPPIHAADGQKVHLILKSQSSETTREILTLMETNCFATFLLTVDQMSDGDLLRQLIGTGHSVVVQVQGNTEKMIREELLHARELMWNNAHAPLHLVWYEGKLDISQLLDETGFLSVSAELSPKGLQLKSSKAALTLFNKIGQSQEDITVFLGYDRDCLDGISTLLDHLQEAQFHLSSWRLTTGK